METCKIKNLYNLNETIASALFEGAEYPWEVLPKISAFILEITNALPGLPSGKRKSICLTYLSYSS